MKASLIPLALTAGVVVGWLAHGVGTQPVLAASLLQGQTMSSSGTVTAIAVCFGTVSPPAGWSTAGATANMLATSGYKISAVLPATGPEGCSNPQIVWGQR